MSKVGPFFTLSCLMFSISVNSQRLNNAHDEISTAQSLTGNEDRTLSIASLSNANVPQPPEIAAIRPDQFSVPSVSFITPNAQKDIVLQGSKHQIKLITQVQIKDLLT